MRRLMVIIVALLVLPKISLAQDIQGEQYDPKTFRASIAHAVYLAEASAPEVGEAVAKIEIPKKQKFFDKKLVIVAATLFVAQYIDTDSTIDVTKRCPNCGEKNPIVRPFINNPLALRLGGMITDVGVTYITGKFMRRHENPAIRRMWPVIPLAMAGLHISGAINNRGVGWCATPNSVELLSSTTNLKACIN